MVKKITLITFIAMTYMLLGVMGYLGFATYQQNLVGWFLIVTAFTYGLIGPYLLWSNLKSEKVSRHENRDVSFWLIVPGFIIVFYASPLEYLYLPNTLPHLFWMQVVGLACIVACMLLFGWARHALGAFYSGRVRVTADQHLVQNGPYRVIRHPGYASYILMSIGIAIGYSSLIGLLVIPLLLVPALIYRITVEEKLLSSQFGDQFTHYANYSYRLIPGIW